MGGMVLETNMNEIVAQVEVQNRMEKSEVSFIAHLRAIPVSPLREHNIRLTKQWLYKRFLGQCGNIHYVTCFTEL